MSQPCQSLVSRGSLIIVVPAHALQHAIEHGAAQPVGRIQLAQLLHRAAAVFEPPQAQIEIAVALEREEIEAREYGVEVFEIRIAALYAAPIWIEPQRATRPGKTALCHIEGFFKANDLTLPVFLLDGPTQTMLGVNQIPLSVLLDRGGNVVRIYPGFSPASMADLRRELHGLLAERSGKGGK